MSGPVKFLLKLAVTGAILTALATMVDMGDVGRLLANANPLVLLVGLGLTTVQAFWDSIRWRTILRALGHGIRIPVAMNYIIIAYFFANLMPSGIGFDAFRAAQMRRFGVPLGVAVRSVVLDRLCALFSLLGVIALGWPILWALTADSPLHRVVLGGVSLAGIGGLAGLLLLPVLMRLFPAVLSLPVLSSAPARKLVEFARTFGAVLANPKRFAIILLSGALVHLARLTTVFILARTLGITVDYPVFFALVPVSLLLAMVPISLADWGVREATFVFTLALAGVGAPEAFALSVAFGLFRLFVGAFGGLFWLATGPDLFHIAVDAHKDNAAAGRPST